MALSFVRKLGRKAKALTLASVIGASAFVSNAYNQVILSISGPQQVQVGVPTQYHIVFDSTNPNVSNQQIASVIWQLNSTNSENVSLTDYKAPSTNDLFTGFNVNDDLSDILGEGSERFNEDYETSGPYNADMNYLASFNLTFGSSGDYTLSLGNVDIIKIDETSFLQEYVQANNFNVQVGAVPEPSTYGLLAGAGALAAAAGWKRRRDSRKSLENVVSD